MPGMGLGDQGDDAGPAVPQGRDQRVVGGVDARPPGRAEGRELRVLEVELDRPAEELGVLGVGARPAALDIAHAQTVQLPRDRQLVRDRRVEPLLLHAVAQGGVVDVERAVQIQWLIKRVGWLVHRCLSGRGCPAKKNLSETRGWRVEGLDALGNDDGALVHASSLPCGGQVGVVVSIRDSRLRSSAVPLLDLPTSSATSRAVAGSSERRAGGRQPVDALARDDHAEQGCDEEQPAAHRQPVSPAPAEGMDDPRERRAEPAGARPGPQRDAERGAADEERRLTAERRGVAEQRGREGEPRLQSSRTTVPVIARSECQGAVNASCGASYHLLPRVVRRSAPADAASEPVRNSQTPRSTATPVTYGATAVAAPRTTPRTRPQHRGGAARSAAPSVGARSRASQSCSHWITAPGGPIVGAACSDGGAEAGPGWSAPGSPAAARAQSQRCAPRDHRSPVPPAA